VVISASHNPWRDNGIKLFGPDGFKLADAVELAMEEEILHHAASIHAPDPASLPPVEDPRPTQADYIQFLIAAVPGLNRRPAHRRRLRQRSGRGIAPELFSAHWAAISVTLLNTARTAATSTTTAARFIPKVVAAEVAGARRDLGITFDGDADRCMLAGARNNVINGDAILLMAARDLQARAACSPAIWS
jgi:phosphoglucosamine mutase